MDAVNGGIVNTSAGYELPYPVYIASLEPSLKHHYPEPEVRPRAPPAPAPAPAPAPGADPVGPELFRIKTYLNDPAHANRRPPRMNYGTVNALVNRAKESAPVAALGTAVPFDVAAYRVAVLAHLNANAPGEFNFASVGP
jgi:hypothetical protein